MLKATLYLQRSTNDTVDNDDIIRIYDDEYHHTMVRVVYSTPELRKDTEFITSIPEAMLYVRDILKSLPRDSQPFVTLQITTAIHPSILYTVEDLMLDPDTRYLIEDTVESALRHVVVRTHRG
jgi:hypothetical protein